ncbi:MAG TPA: hypothetical protein VFE62_28925 [Gemmataceae bacterium]|nr:hypothetical protein [Gemmataceae bacterium]
MLSDEVLELLTGYVDGELTARERAVLMRLLERSSEARGLLRQLMEDSHRLKQLSAQPSEPGLPGDFLQQIAQQQLLQASRQKATAERWWLPLLAISSVASLLIGACSLLYWYNAGRNGEIKTGNVKKSVPLAAKNQTPDKKQIPAQVQPAPPTPNEEKSKKPLPAPSPAPPPADPVIQVAFGDLVENGRASAQLVDSIKRRKDLLIDIRVSNNPLAVERLRAAFHTAKINLLADPGARAALREKDNRKQAMLNYLVYADNLEAGEMVKILQEISRPDTSGAVSSVPSPYVNALIETISETQKLAAVLGVEAERLKSSEAASVKSTSDWREAMVLAPTPGKEASREVRDFVERRPGMQANTMRVVIKVHQ